MYNEERAKTTCFSSTGEDIKGRYWPTKEARE